jgi:hypothetical protein
LTATQLGWDSESDIRSAPVSSWPVISMSDVRNVAVYLAWRLRGEPPVLLDGRPRSGVSYLRRCLAVPAEFEALARTRRFQLVVLALHPFPPTRLFRHLMASPEWGLVHFDGEGAVFVRSTVLERALLGRVSPDAALPEVRPRRARGRWPGGCDPGAASAWPHAAAARLTRTGARRPAGRALHCPER